MTIISCGPKVVYNHEVALGDKWNYDKPVVFNAFSIKDSSSIYDLVLEIDHSAEFNYQNIYTKVKTTYPDGRKNIDPLSIELANKMGSWLSDCNNDICKLHLILLDDIKFRDPGDYQITFIQDTRQEDLVGIYRMELKLIVAE